MSEIGRVATDGDKATVAVAIGLRRVQQPLYHIDALASRGNDAEIVG